MHMDGSSEFEEIERGEEWTRSQKAGAIFFTLIGVAILGSLYLMEKAGKLWKKLKNIFG